MKKIALLSVSLLISLLIGAQTAWACDGYLKIPQQDPRRAQLYSRDCQIQDRFATVKNFFAANKININELAEYRALRFFDRASFNRAAANGTPLSEIYDPAPVTWNVWNTGIKTLFGADPIPFVLFKSLGFNLNTAGYEGTNFSTINQVLLKNEMGDVSRDHLNGKAVRSSVPGTYREVGDGIIGFHIPYDPEYQDKIDRSQESMRRTQEQWEKDYGMPFSAVVQRAGGLNPDQATFGVSMLAQGKPDNSGMFVGYAPSEMVPTQISWILAFVNASIDRYRIGKPLMPPIEFSAFVQKWFVTVHPFSDGNGRTSRAVQDFILATFKMPYAPGGDLQNDAVEEYDKYIDKTYEKMESMVAKLESCMNEYRANSNKISYGCKQVDQITKKKKGWW
jgi:uncharacterized protein YukE